jgi:hypothetical protein
LEAIPFRKKRGANFLSAEKSGTGVLTVNIAPAGFFVELYKTPAI